jgi:hypothetical protein
VFIEEFVEVSKQVPGRRSPLANTLIRSTDGHGSFYTTKQNLSRTTEPKDTDWTGF